MNRVVESGRIQVDQVVGIAALGPLADAVGVAIAAGSDARSHGRFRHRNACVSAGHLVGIEAELPVRSHALVEPAQVGPIPDAGGWGGIVDRQGGVCAAAEPCLAIANAGFNVPFHHHTVGEVVSRAD